WICALSGGLYKMIPGGEPELMSMPVIADSRLGAQQVREAIEDEYCNIWYGSFSGLFCFDPQAGTTRRIEIPTNLGGLTHPSIFAMFHDDKGTIWAGSYYGGVNYFTPRHDDFINYSYEGHAPAGLYHSYILDMVVDNDGHLWFGTDGAGVCCVDSLWNIREQLTSLPSNKSLRQNNIKALAYDADHNRLYIGTHLGGLACYDISSGQTSNFINDTGIREMLGAIIHHLKIQDGTLYMSTRTGMWKMDLVTRRISKITSFKASYPFNFDISPEGDIYMHTLFRINKLDKRSGKISQLICSDALSGQSNVLYSGNCVYFTSLGRGFFVYDPKSESIKNYTTANSSLPSDYCYNLCADNAGNIIIMTDGAVVRHNRNDDTFQTIKFADMFPESRLISECGIMVKHDGSILIGSTKGITKLFPDKFDNDPTKNRTKSDFHFAQLSIQNEMIYPNDDSGVLQRALPYTEDITLRSDQNTFSLRLALCDYINSQTSYKFQYRMDGIDHSWHTSNEGEIHYTNLNPGHYTLRARYSSDGITPGADEISLHITVNNPWYTSWWAYLIYTMCIVVGIVLFFKNRQARILLHSTLEKERFEKHQIEKLNHEKLVFFTNVSHEFQTPLTLIISHIDLLMSKFSRHAGLRDGLKRIREHAEQMSHLITQLLEFRKIQQNHQTFHVAEHDAATTLANVAAPFVAYAVQRNIKFTIANPSEVIKGYYDEDMISKVLVNLISNAFKYTSDGGEITVSVQRGNDGKIIFNVTDTGRGISPKDINYIFERFYNGSANEGPGLNYKSTGIGLAFAKSIVDKHHGAISVDSHQGEGSTFTVIIPATRDVFADDPNVVFEAVGNLEIPEPIEPLPDEYGNEARNNIDTTDIENEESVDVPSILIVEDNAELRHNLTSFFSQYYRVESASNGREGLERVRKLNPSIVISDIMMPE
ncbi:MAG: response regulator, partial [Muribaculaceae bacterium]|nr:response regulator [Muribaculaceae bacterium]